MSTDGEPELKDLVLQTLEAQGTLYSLRAQLRANVFLSLEENELNTEPLAKKLRSHLGHPEVQLAFCLVYEFLEYFKLKFTLAVYEQESLVGSAYDYCGRNKLSTDLGVAPDGNAPLLLYLLKECIDNTRSQSTNESINTNVDNSSLAESKNHLNETFNITSLIPSDSSPNTKKDESPNTPETVPSARSSTKSDDSYKSSSNENKDESQLIDLETSVRLTGNVVLPPRNLLDQTIVPEEESKSVGNSPPSVKEKPKPVSGLSSLSDLPPLQIKPRNVDTVLPSLYAKKEKGLKEIDKMLDLQDNYEEDFISDYDHKSDGSDVSKLISPQVPSPTKKSEVNSNHEDKKNDRSNDSPSVKLKTLGNVTSREKDTDSSISESLEFDTNADALKSESN